MSAATRHRGLWIGNCTVIAAVLAGFGVAYLALGLQAAPTPRAYEAVTRYVPGGIRTYGGIMLAYAAAVLHGIIPPLHGDQVYVRWLHAVLMSVAGLTVAVIVAFTASWIDTGVPTWPALVYWAAVGVLAALAAHYTPSDRVGDGAS